MITRTGRTFSPLTFIFGPLNFYPFPNKSSGPLFIAKCPNFNVVHGLVVFCRLYFYLNPLVVRAFGYYLRTERVLRLIH